MKAISEYDLKEVSEAVESYSLYYRNKEGDIGHGFARAHGAIVANLEMLLHRAMRSEDEALQEYATEMVERFNKKLEENI